MLVSSKHLTHYLTLSHTQKHLVTACAAVNTCKKCTYVSYHILLIKASSLHTLTHTRTGC